MNQSLIVEAIVDRRVFSGKVLYLTRWKGSDECTWESVKVLKHYRDLIKSYNLVNRNKLCLEQQDQQPHKSEKHQPEPALKIQQQQTTTNQQQQQTQLSSPPLKEQIATKQEKQGNKQRQLVQKRRGRPPKNNKPELDQKCNKKLKQPKSSTLKQQMTVRTQPECIQPQSESHSMKDVKPVNPSPEDNQETAGLRECSSPFSRIKSFVIQSSSSQVKYSVEYSDASERIYSTEQMVRLHPLQLAQFLQHQLRHINKIATNPL